MSEHDVQLPDGLVAVAPTALAIRSATLVRRGLALANNLGPDCARVHINLGVSLWEKGDLDGAIAEFRQAIRLRPDYYEAHFGLAELYKYGDLDGAIAEYREAIRLKPDYAEAHYGLGEALDRRAERPEDEARSIDRLHRAGYLQSAAVVNNRDRDRATADLEDAIAEFRTVTNLKPDNADAHAKLGTLLWRRGELTGGVSEMRSAVRLDPRNWLLHYMLAHRLQESGDLDGEIEELRAGVAYNPDEPLLRYNLGVALCGKGDLDGAITEFRTAIQLMGELTKDGWPAAHHDLGTALERKGEVEGALHEYCAASALEPRNDTYRQAYERLAKWTERRSGIREPSA